MSNFEIYSYQDLCNERYTGIAWNVYYEYGRDDEWWGHSGEYADELDAWFKDLNEAKAFADTYCENNTLEDMLYNSPYDEGARSIMLNIEECYWNDGTYDLGNETFFVRYDKDEAGNVEMVENVLGVKN